MSAHDVRSLGTCCLCQKLGSYDPRLTGIDLLLVLQTGYGPKKAPKVGAHPRCLVRYDKDVRHADISFITILGPDEMGKIRRDDLPDDIYRRLIVAHDAQVRQISGGK